MALYRSPDYQTFGSREEVQYRFSRWWLSWISNKNDYCSFDLQVTLILPISFKSIGLLVQDKKFKIDFQHGC